MYDKPSQSINSFMTTQRQNYKESFQKFFGEKSSVESSDDDTSNKSSKFWFFIEIDLERQKNQV